MLFFALATIRGDNKASFKLSIKLLAAKEAAGGWGQVPAFMKWKTGQVMIILVY
eukprot:COSAG01_NODE_8405_length_2795_cov_5.327522_3_plen_54_part_00